MKETFENHFINEFIAIYMNFFPIDKVALKALLNRPLFDNMTVLNSLQ